MSRAGRLLVLAWLMVAAGAAAQAATWTASGIVNYRDREFDQTGFTGVELKQPRQLRQTMFALV